MLSILCLHRNLKKLFVRHTLTNLFINILAYLVENNFFFKKSKYNSNLQNIDKKLITDERFKFYLNKKVNASQIQKIFFET